MKIACVTVALAALACNGTSPDRGSPITPPPMGAAQADLAALRTMLAAVPRTADELLAARAVRFLPTLPYDPAAAVQLPKIQASALALDSRGEAALRERGFAIADNRQFVTFIHGYKSIYAEHLPVYVSADSILYALHRSYDAILRTLEEKVLIGELGALLAAMRQALPATEGLSPARADVDLYLAVAVSLLEGNTKAPVAGGNAAQVSRLVASAMAAAGEETIELFGGERRFDFSQFTPRGHYTRSQALERYFRTMMWLGRTELRVIETLADGSQVFRRRQLDGALLLRRLVDAQSLTRWRSIDRVVRAFVGEPDDMTLPDLDALIAALGGPDDLAGKTDQEIADTIHAKGYGAQRIASQIMVNGLEKDTLPLGRSFLFFGQRYVIDSHVFSNVVYDRVKKAKVKRMMPNPLDVAAGALGNDAAFGLLEPDLRRHDYASELAGIRLLADAHGEDFWRANLYNRWLSALRALSPERDLQQSGLPSVARTAAWSRRVLNTQLASWAELRHDTILYAKQSYTGVPACEYPDAYVEPYPAFWTAVAALGADGGAVIESLGLDTRTTPAFEMRAFFRKLEETSLLLADMAERQRTGQPFTAAQLLFVNQAVSLVPFGCAQTRAEGWYADLFYDRDEATQFDPTIADVHSQPADEGGNPVGRVLHVATGHPRLMVVTVDTCSGPRAYAGVISSYFERITEQWKRLTDKEWASGLTPATPADVSWMSELVVR